MMPIPEFQRRASRVCVLGSIRSRGREGSPAGRARVRSVRPERCGAKAALSTMGEGMSLQGQEWRVGEQPMAGFGDAVIRGPIVDSKEEDLDEQVRRGLC